MQKHQYIYKRCQGQPKNSGEGLNFQISMTFRLLILHITSASISSRLYKARFPVDWNHKPIRLLLVALLHFAHCTKAALV